MTLALFNPLLAHDNTSFEEPAAKAARAQAGARYDNFVAALGRRLSLGPKLRQGNPRRRAGRLEIALLTPTK